ncbi:MFS transporter [Streptomyces sp. MspMP-M5]|uniref:MFS transporter n=1 Tax=unclassified Streptomyces TaxID=2593676 RepID=UPI000363B0C4|nr:MFS transporter [Streptomyces sp. MspMP-M5]
MTGRPGGSRTRTPRTPDGAPLSPGARRIIRLNNGFQLLFNLLWWMPVFYEYQRQAGLTDGQIFGIQSIYYLAFCLFEIPTGLIADRIGTRNCLRAGAVVMTAANLVPVLTPHYSGFLVHFLLIAAGRSLTSGAASAYLYDGLQAEDASGHYLKAEGQARAWGLAAKVLCWPLVGPLMDLAHGAPYVLSAASAGGSLVCAVLLPHQYAPDGRARNGSSGPRAAGTVRHEAAAALRIVRARPWLALVMVQGVALFTLARICQVNLFQPVLLAHAVPTSAHGAALAAMTVAEAVGSARPHWLSGRLSPVTWVSLLSLVMAAALAGSTLGGPWTVVALLCLFAAATGLGYPLQRKLVNDAIPAGAPRATLLSLESIVDRAVCALVAVAAGGYLSAGRLDALLWHSALATAALLAVLHPLLRRTGEVAQAHTPRANQGHTPRVTANTPQNAATTRIEQRKCPALSPGDVSDFTS